MWCSQCVNVEILCQVMFVCLVLCFLSGWVIIVLPMCQSWGFVSSPGFVLILCFLSSLVIIKPPICQGGGCVKSCFILFLVGDYVSSPVFLVLFFCLAR